MSSTPRTTSSTRAAKRPARAKTAAAGPPVDRRAEILATAARVFATKGYANSTVRDIGHEVGILSGSLYYHFESKDAMLLEILGDALDYLLGAYGSVLEMEDTEEHLRALLSICVEWIAEHRNAALVLQNDFNHIRHVATFAPVIEKYEGIRQIWIEVLRRGMNEGVLRDDIDVDEAYRILLGAALSIVHWFDPKGPRSPQSIVDVLTKILLTGMAGPKLRPPMPTVTA